MRDLTLDPAIVATNGVVIGPRGLTVTRELSEEEWLGVGRLITRRLSQASWLVGDWLVYGGKFSGGRWSSGIGSYVLAQEVTGMSRSHLSNCYRTAATFPAGEWLRTLSWAHHCLLVCEPPARQRELISQAESNGWTCNDLRQRIVLTRDRPRPRLVNRPSYVYARTHVKCPHCATVFQVQGNKCSPPAAVPEAASA
jgi:hypothetical protein